jgi:hypothetical protein
MARNEIGHDVPPRIEEMARQHACIHGTQSFIVMANIRVDAPLRASVAAAPLGSVALITITTRSSSVTDNSARYQNRGPVPPRQTFDQTLDAILRLTDPRTYEPTDDAWLHEAIDKTEEAIDALVREFLETPYLHRVEHSLHLRLYGLVRSRFDDVANTFQIGHELGATQLVHKEWPETFPRPEKNDRRGNFDIVVLSPKLLASCKTIEEFRQGRLPAPIVIEMGLDYEVHHLAKDARK